MSPASLLDPGDINILVNPRNSNLEAVFGNFVGRLCSKYSLVVHPSIIVFVL